LGARAKGQHTEEGWDLAGHIRRPLFGGRRHIGRKPRPDKANVATFSTTAGCKQFRIFRACLDDLDQDQQESESFTAFDATLIVDDEDNDQR
jgi:hypothetical protein